MAKKFVPLFEILTGKKHELTERILQSQKEKEHEARDEFIEKIKEEEEEKLPPISLESERLPEIEIAPPPIIEEEFLEAEKPELTFVEVPRVEEVKIEEIPSEEIPKAPPEVQPKIPEQLAPTEEAEKHVPHVFSEVEREIYTRSEEITTEEREHSYIKERIEGKRKIVEGGEDLKRKIVISIVTEDETLPRNGKMTKDEFTRSPVFTQSPEDKSRMEGEPTSKEDTTTDATRFTTSRASQKSAEEKFKIISMDDEKIERKEDLDTPDKEESKKRPYEFRGTRLFLHEIIDRIRSDIIAKAELDSKKIISEAERRAKEIIDNAHRESEKIINETIARTLDISREIEKESEEKGYKAGFDKGYEEGKAKGYEDAYKKTLSEGRYALEMLRKLSDEIAYAKERFSDDFPKIVLHLTLVALKTILMTDFLKDEELIVRTIKEALDKVRDFKIVKIKINPQDLETVKKFFHIPSEIEISPDPLVEKGDVKIEMREGYFESSIKWREKIIEETLRSELENLIQKREEEKKQDKQLKATYQEMKEEMKEKLKEEISKVVKEEKEI